MTHDLPNVSALGAVSHTSRYSHLVFQTVSALFEGSSGFERTLVIAGHKINIRYLNEELQSLLSKAFVQSSGLEGSGPGLTICACDFDSVPAAFPAPPWEMDSPTASGPNVQRPMLHFRDEQYIGVYEPLSALLSLLDTNNDQAIWCIPRRKQIPPYELSAPFRPIFHWWLGARGLQIVHAGAVANEITAILLAGRSGSGKSTTALLAIDAGLRYLGDDYVLVEDLPLPTAWGLFRTGKLFHADFGSFPQLSTAVDDISFRDREKTIMYLEPSRLSRQGRGLPIGAILLPRVTDTATSSLIRVSPATCLRAMAPSTMLQLRGSGPRDFERLSRLVCSVPSYRLDLGTDRQAVQQVMLDLMENLQA